MNEKIREIQKDKTLSSEEKMKKIQELMTPKPTHKSNYNVECEHYKKNCSRFYFSCCGLYDPCMRCHRERNICKRPILEKITCNKCSLEQEPSPQCKRCSILFGNFYCNICSIWTERTDIYHCNDCGICRVGPREVTFHCFDCGTCFHKSDYNHICSKKSYKEEVCIICKEDLFTSQKEFISLPCSHFIHQECFQDCLQYQRYQCPFCKKSMINMESIWSIIRKEIKRNKVPEDMIEIKENNIIPTRYGKFKIKEITDLIYKGNFIDWKLKDGSLVFASLQKKDLEKNIYLQIYCNDCEKKSYSLYHFYGLMCNFCKGFNTQE